MCTELLVGCGRQCERRHGNGVLDHFGQCHGDRVSRRVSLWSDARDSQIGDTSQRESCIQVTTGFINEMLCLGKVVVMDSEDGTKERTLGRIRLVY